MNPTVYLIDTNSLPHVEQLRSLGWGRLWSVKNVQPPAWPGEPIALDNGAYACFQRGVKFDEAKFQRRVDRCVENEIDLNIAVLPDVVGGGRRSLEYSSGWYHYRDIPHAWPWFLVVQDGMTGDMIDDYHLDDIAGIFLGGTDEFKSTAQFWRDWSRERGLRFHYGRCNTIRRVEAAIDIGVDSVDSFALHPMFWNSPHAARCVSLLTGKTQPHPTLDWTATG